MYIIRDYNSRVVSVNEMLTIEDFSSPEEIKIVTKALCNCPPIDVYYCLSC